MTNVLLSADGDISVYSVPDAASRDLEKLCLAFARETGGVFDETDFIRWQNTERYPSVQSVFLENISSCWSPEDRPPRYRDCKWYNF